MSQTTQEYTKELKRTLGISETDRHRLLADERRRVVLDVLWNRTAPVGLEELAADVAAQERNTADPESDFRDRIMVSLYHHHLPMMAELGVVEYDREADRVAAPG